MTSCGLTPMITRHQKLDIKGIMMVPELYSDPLTSPLCGGDLPNSSHNGVTKQMRYR